MIRFAYKHSLAIIADEVYQTNLHTPKRFISFKKAVREIEAPFNQVELVSFHSISKGFIGECGVRGGYMEFVNFDPKVMAQIHKVRDSCSVNVAGTIAVSPDSLPSHCSRSRPCATLLTTKTTRRRLRTCT